MVTGGHLFDTARKTERSEVVEDHVRSIARPLAEGSQNSSGVAGGQKNEHPDRHAQRRRRASKVGRATASVLAPRCLPSSASGTLPTRFLLVGLAEWSVVEACSPVQVADRAVHSFAPVL
jgi:hypothetical protein